MPFPTIHLPVLPISVSAALRSFATAFVFSFATPTTAQAAEPVGGVAAYASYTDASYASQEANRLQNLLQSDVQINPVIVNGTRYQRLQSAPVARHEAQSLVRRAKAAGYSAWYVSAPANSAASRTATVAVELQKPKRPQILLSQANPELAAMLPDGPLLGDIYPPRTPLSE